MPRKKSSRNLNQKDEENENELHQFSLTQTFEKCHFASGTPKNGSNEKQAQSFFNPVQARPNHTENSSSPGSSGISREEMDEVHMGDVQSIATSTFSNTKRTLLSH